MKYVTCFLFAFVAMAFGQATAPDATATEASARTVQLTAQLPNQSEVFFHGMIWKPGFVVAPAIGVSSLILTGEKDIRSLSLVAWDISHLIGLFQGDPKNLGSNLMPMKVQTAPAPAPGAIVRIWGRFGWQNAIVTAAEKNDMLVLSTINPETLSGAAVYKEDVFVGMVIGQDGYLSPDKGGIREAIKFPSLIRMVSTEGMLQKLLAKPKVQPLRRPTRPLQVATRQ